MIPAELIARFGGPCHVHGADCVLTRRRETIAARVAAHTTGGR